MKPAELQASVNLSALVTRTSYAPTPPVYARLGCSRSSRRCRGVLRFVDVATNERDHVSRAFDASKARIERQLCHPCRRLDLRLQNIGLQGVQKSLLEQIRGT